MAHFVLGIDLGTSAVKVALVDRHGRVVDGEREPYPMLREPFGAMEQDPRDWTRAVLACVHRLAVRQDLALVSAVGLTGQLPTLVVVRDGQPLGYAVTWLDGRADAWTRRHLGPRLRQEVYRITGMPMVDGRYLGPMYAYHHVHGAPRADRGDRLLSAKDYLYRWLTGDLKTDPATAAGYGMWDLVQRTWSPELAHLWSLDTTQLPSVAEGADQAGRLLDERAREFGLPLGVSVHVGTGDSLAAVVGSGGLASRCLTVVWGSSTALIGSVSTPVLDDQARYLVTPHVMPGLYAVEADLLATGAGIDWLSGLVGRQPESLVREAAAVPPGADGVRFAPYVAGAEQGVLWRDRLAGTVIGLTTAHTMAHLVRAFLEGVAFEIRRCLEVLAGPMDGVDDVVLIGLGSGGDWVAGLLADVLARDIRHVHDSLAAARGAAILTGATHIAADDGSAIRALLAVDTVACQPTELSRSLYETLYEEHLGRFPRLARRRPPPASP